MIHATGNRMTAEIRRQSGLAQAIAREQIAISTGKRIQKASDDPVAAARVSALREAHADGVAWTANLDLGASLTAQAEGVLTQMADRMARARELVVSGASQALSPADRATIAAELSGIADEINSYAGTTSSLGQPLFSTGPAPAFRFSDSATFAPVPARAAVFDISGIPLTQILSDAAAAIASGNSGAIAGSLTGLGTAISHVADVASDIGVRAGRIDRLKESHISRSISFAAERSSVEDTDLSAAITRLNAHSVTLEAAQAAFARINRRTLMDVLG
jgi:flagellar hook-associated protein 3 FlgL